MFQIFSATSGDVGATMGKVSLEWEDDKARAPPNSKSLSQFFLQFSIIFHKSTLSRMNQRNDAKQARKLGRCDIFLRYRI